MTAIRSSTSALLRRFSDLLERNPWIVLALLVLLYLSACFDASRSKPLWHDELYTYYITLAPTLGQMWHETRTLDLNPPLIYCLARASFHLFGANALAARLPEIAGFLVGLLCLFRFVRVRMGVLFAAFAFALVLATDLFSLAVEARPYGLLLGSLGLAMVAWQAAAPSDPSGNPTAPRTRRFAVAVLFLAVLAMVLSHALALLPIAALIAAQLWRTRDGRFDLPVTAALVLPLAAALLIIPSVKTHAVAIYPPSFQVDISEIIEFYIGSVYIQVGALLLTALAVLLLLGPAHLRGGPRKVPPTSLFTPPEWVLIGGLLLCPLVLLLKFMASHAAFFDRYGAVEGFAAAILIAVLLCRWTMDHGVPDSRAALFGTVIALVISGTPATLPKQWHEGDLLPTFANSVPRPKPCSACLRAAAIDPTLPLVDASGLTFVEMNHNESPATLDHLFYLTDTQASTQIAHANIFEGMAEVVRAFHLLGHAEPYQVFVSTHHHFFVLGQHDYPEDWLLRKLEADGADIRLLGRTDDSYHDTEFYEVTLAPNIR